MAPAPHPQRWTDALREWSLDLIALVWPAQCVACGAPDRECCRSCRDELYRSRDRVLQIRAPAGVGARVAGAYSGRLRAVLVAYKHAGRTGFAGILGEQLCAPLRATLQECGGPVLLVAAASRPKRVRERGYRHVEVLVSAALRRGPWPARGAPKLLPRALRARPGRTSQVGLAAAARLRNAALVTTRRGARRALAGARVILIDDVITTGATVQAAAAALTDAGAKVVGIVALCAVARRDDRREVVPGDTRGPSLQGEVEAEAPNAVGFVKGDTVRPAMRPPA